MKMFTQYHQSTDNLKGGIFMWRRLAIFALVLLVAVSFSTKFPRNETLYIGGGIWAPPSNWNPFVPWNAVDGTVGMIYETLFFYDPLTGKLQPWLAESGKWTDPKTFVVKLREGTSWQDGKPLTSEDVKFTFEIAKKYKAFYYSGVWDWLDSIETPDDRTVVFHFSQPRYHNWLVMMYTVPIVPKHIWANKSQNEIFSTANKNPIGSGMYKAEEWDQDKMVFLRNDNWWGIKYFGKPAPKRVVHIKIFSNNVALGMILKGELDWSGFFLPGIPRLVKSYGGLVTWYNHPPYMLPDNVAYLFMNTKKAPMDNPLFRRAVAFAINVNEIVDKVYEDQVEKARPSGYLPIPAWDKFYDKKLDEEYGFHYNPIKAERLLDEAGIVDKDGDGWRDLPNGKPFKLEIIVPYGWTDWMESIKIIAKDLNAVGINAEPKFPDYGKYWEDITKGTFDMAINNFGSQVSMTPWTLYNFVVHYPISDAMYDGNFGRYDNEELFNLLEKINQTPLSKEKELKELFAKAQKILLTQMPAVPLWYNGLWFQANSTHWTNWPTEKNPYAYPCLWSGRWQVGGLKVLLNLKPAK